MIAHVMLGKTFLQAQGPCPSAQIKIWCQGSNVTGAKSYLLGISMEEIDWIFFCNDFLWFSVFWWKKSLRLAGWNCMRLQVWRWLPHVSTVERVCNLRFSHSTRNRLMHFLFENAKWHIQENGRRWSTIHLARKGRLVHQSLGQCDPFFLQFPIELQHVGSQYLFCD